MNEIKFIDIGNPFTKSLVKDWNTQENKCILAFSNEEYLEAWKQYMNTMYSFYNTCRTSEITEELSIQYHVSKFKPQLNYLLFNLFQATSTTLNPVLKEVQNKIEPEFDNHWIIVGFSYQGDVIEYLMNQFFNFLESNLDLNEKNVKIFYK